jgi:carboxyl-terminal processing protease
MNLNGSFLRFRWPIIPITLALGLGLIAGIVLDQVAVGGMQWFDNASGFRLISDAWKIIENIYVDRAAVKPRSMTYGAISGMVDSLGDTGHSRFLDPGMVKALRNLQKNKFEGVGAEIQMKDGHVVVVASLDNSPAQQAGIQAGDIILKVNGTDITGLPLDQVVARVSGPAGTSVTLTILSTSSGQTREIILKRAAVKIENVRWQRLPGTKTAHLRISSFNRGMADDLRAALAKIRNGDLDSIIVDLRNNPGGLLNEAVEATSQFLENGNVLLVKNSRGDIKSIPVQSGGEATRTPLAVLINSGTASAAEIMAGAIRSAHRATLIGVPTFGTGTVLREFGLPDGSALLLAVEEWLTPSGKAIWHKGIAPDVRVDLPAGATPLLPDESSKMTAAQLQNCKDTQLLRAIKLLNPPEIAAFHISDGITEGIFTKI